MTRVLHIIDGTISRDAAWQLELLVAEGDDMVSVDPPPAWWPAHLPARSEHVPLGMASLCGRRLTAVAWRADIVHAWSLRAAEAAAEAARGAVRPGVVSLPCVPTGHDLRRALNAPGFAGLHLTVPTRSARAALLEAGGFDDRIHVLPAPARVPDDTAERRRRIRAELGVSDDEALVVAPGEMTHTAGHMYASWAHAIVRHIRPGLRLLLPGGGAAFRHVRFFAGTTGFDEEVFLPGERVGLDDALAAADVATFFAERDNGTAALVRALASGVAVTACRTRDVCELTDDGRAALLVRRRMPRDYASAVLELVENSARRKALVAEGLTVAGEHAPERCRRALEAIYEAAAGVRCGLNA
ncbi:MAG: glycosyltransferase [Phycisphaerae bacterium]|nr:glycosyltransferase [Phycisphaerae bacterium]